MTDNTELLADLRSRINPAYENQRGTESYERKQCADAIEALESQRDSFKDRWEENEIENGEQQSQIEKLEAEVERLTLERDVNKRMRDQHFAEVESQKQMVIKLQSLLDANISLNEWLQAQLAASPQPKAPK